MKIIKDESEKYGIDFIVLHSLLCMGVADLNREIVQRGLSQYRGDIKRFRRRMRNRVYTQRRRDRKRALIKEKDALDKRIKYLEGLAKANGIEI